MAQKVATVGIVGRTNAGKSTLVNALVGEKVSIVSPVEQTTRNTVRGIVSDERGQLVLLDTPGLHKAVGELGRLLNQMARRQAAQVDILCVVFDASQAPQMEDIGWMSRVAKEKPAKVVFVLNKADKAPFFESMFREEWGRVVEEWKSGKVEECGGKVEKLKSGKVEECGDGVGWVKSVASTPGGAKAVGEALFALADEGEKLFDDDIVTDYPRKLAISDCVREKFLAFLHQELPHELGIYVKSIKETQTDSRPRWEVDVEVLVNRESQKPIVIGRGASVIKRVRQQATRELSQIFDAKVTLELWVRVANNWMKDRHLLMEMGYLGDLI